MSVMPFFGVVPNLKPGSNVGKGGYAGILFVSGDFGTDANDGLSPDRPLKNLDTAYNLTAGGANEIIFVLGGAASVNLSSKIASGGVGLVWAKNHTHLIGLAAPGTSGMRARISNGASTNLYTPLLKVTGTGCYFRNIEFFNGGAHATQAAVCVLVDGSAGGGSGNYNTFENCQISGGGHATAAANAACRSLVVTGSGAGGGGENTFRHCYIGLSTMIRSTTSSEMEFTGATVRNVFEDCTIISWSSSTGTLLVKIGAAGIQSSLVFRRCLFIGNNAEGSGVALAQAMSVNSAPGGIIATSGCLTAGCTKVESTASGLVFAESASALLGLANTA